eukprot:TCONS_00014288-protein
MLEFQIILPTGQSINIILKSKESTGKHLKESVFKSVNILLDDKEYFGLKYSDRNDDTPSWITDTDNLKSMSFLKADSKHPSMQLSVRMYPPNPDFAMSTPESRNLFRCHMKNLLVSNNLGCDSRTHAMLDGFVAQYELGDYHEETMKAEYGKKMNKINIYAPSILSAGTPIGEAEYIQLVRSYHRKLSGVRPAQADILYLGMVQKLPLYGYKVYNISDKINKNYHMAISAQGIHFFFESILETFTIPKHREAYPWACLVFAEQERNKVKLGFFNDKGAFSERYVKVSGKFSNRSGAKLVQDVELHKANFLDKIDGTQSIVYDSRKKAQRVHSTKIPRRNSAFNRTVNTLGRSIRSSLRINKKKRISSEADADSGTVDEFELSSSEVHAD